MDADLSKQKAADFFMKLHKERCEWEKFINATMYKKRWPHHLKSVPPGHQITCICRPCLYICHLLLRKHSHVSPAGFYLGCVSLKYKDEEETQEIIEKIWADEEPSIQKLTGNMGYDDPEKLPRNAIRNARYVLEALEFKKKLAAFFETPQSKIVARLGACYEHDGECQKHDLKRQKNLYRFIRRFSRFAIKTRWEFSRTDLLHNFSDENRIGIAGLLNQCREGVRLLSPEFRYPVKWLDDLASKKKGIRVAESDVQAFRKHIEIPKEVEAWIRDLKSIIGSFLRVNVN